MLKLLTNMTMFGSTNRLKL